MRTWGIMGLLVLLTSCEWLESHETKTRKLVESELQGIDWNDVDQYPLFANCDETVVKPAQRDCFEETLIRYFSTTLREFEFILDSEVDDTLYLDFMVDRGGVITVLDIEQNRMVLEQVPEFDGVVTQCLKSLPHLEPALKRGIPVNAKFRIPLVLHSNP